ncbi:hypothetical protein ANN_16039 [Periplaneta americana]|uniref:Uncharacterized protein n=1 Tax=Periplaneta americana TaxID=6978 RepID=A0ABQ8SI49_PERAM|nr:hypothetical protein ANN_16039 [Periplaneta americana]
MNDVEHLHIFSDGRGGQSKNHFQFRLANDLVTSASKAYPIRFLLINDKKMEDTREFKPYIPEVDVVQLLYEEIFAWPTIHKESATANEMLG